jgi:hypothetical protein
MSTDITKSREKLIRPDLTFFESVRKNVYEAGHVILVAIAVLTFFAPQFVEIYLIIWGSVVLMRRKLPYPEGKTYYGGEQKDSTPLYAMGLDMSLKQPVWFTDSQMRQHMLVMGTTGAGKTEFLLYLSAQAMAQGSGVIFVDGKGDVKTWFRLYSIASRFGMEENLRVLNFGTNRKMGDIKYDLSNTIQPFTLGDAGQLSEMMSSLMAESGGDGMWKGRAESMMRALLTALVDLRDLGVVALGPGALSDYMPLDKLGSLETDMRISDLGRSEIKRYLDALPGFRAGGQGKAEADKQHGFLTMQFTEILGLFNNAYGHIMAFKLGEIDMYDVIVNRRSLYVMLPSMEKSGNSVKNLGKIVVNQIRAALSRTLGAGIKGSRAEKLDARPTNSKTPMLCILDEYGSYAVEGFGEVAAQARSIGFSTVFAVQDWASLEKADSKGNEAQRIWANTNIKIIMKVEDSKSTMPIVLDRIKEGFVLSDQGKEYNDDSVLGGYRYQKGLSYKEVKRLDPLKLFTLKNGRMYVLYENRFHEVQSSYLPNKGGAWQDVDFIKPGRLLPLMAPNMDQITQEINMSRNWVFASTRQSHDVIDANIPEEAAHFLEAIKSMNEYFDHDPARQGLEFVRVYMRTALQAVARQAQKVFNTNSPSSAESNPYAPTSPKTAPPSASSMPWQAPVATDSDDDMDSMIDDEYHGEEEDDPYVSHDFDDVDGEEVMHYPEPQNKSMTSLERKEYISGSRQIAEDESGDVTNAMIRKNARGNFEDDDDEDAEGGDDY